MIDRDEMFLPEYRITKLGADMPSREFASAMPAIPFIQIDRFPWSNDYGPKTQVRCGHTDIFCYIGFKVFEEKPVMRHKTFQDPVYEDSCVEFFFNPFPKDSKDYVNLEVNAAGVFLAQIGSERRKRRLLTTDEVKGLEIWASRNEERSDPALKKDWQIVLKIPFSFFVYLYCRPVAFPLKTKGNFYKCGDRTGRPHYGCWSAVQASAADFHQPDFFGTLVFG